MRLFHNAFFPVRQITERELLSIRLKKIKTYFSAIITFFSGCDKSYSKKIIRIAVSFSVSPKWLKILTAYSKRSKIAVKYFDTEELNLKDAEMYITGFKAKLEKDTSYKGLWTVSFTLKEY